MKRILSCLSALLLLLYGSDAFAQAETTVSIPAVSAEAGENVNVPINVTNFFDVGAITLVINYDPAVLTFNGLENTARDGFLSNATAGELRIGWFDATASDPIFIEDGKLADINFSFAGGASAVTFNEGLSEIASSFAVAMDVEYDDGIVAEEIGELSLGDVVAEGIGGTVDVPLDASNLSGVGSVSLIINFDPAVASFVGLSSDDSGLNLVANQPEPGEVRIGGFSTAGVDLEGTVASLEFEYLGGVTTLDFSDNSEVTDTAGDPLVVAFNDGSIADVFPVIFIDSQAAEPGSDIVVPVQAISLQNVGAVSLSILYNPAVLTFTGSSGAVSGLNLTVGEPESGRVNIGGFSTEGVDLADGPIVNLLFTYNGGETELAFDESRSEITNPDGTPYNVFYSDGFVFDIANVFTFYEADLAGVHETPPVPSPGDAFVEVDLTGDNRLIVTGGVFNLSSPYAASHIHVGQVGVPGPVVIPLTLTTFDDRSGFYFVEDNTFDLNTFEFGGGMDTDSFIEALDNGDLYVNVHTQAYGPGEIRGQILPFGNSAPDAASVTSPVDGGEFTTAGDTSDVLFNVSFSDAEDPDGDTIVYIYQISTTSNFSDNVEMDIVPPGIGDVPVSVGFAAEVFDEATGGFPGNVHVGETVTFYHRVITSDGSLWTVGPTSSFSITRGSPTDRETPAELPASFSVDGNYPNPFNPSTSIQFDLPSPAEVSVQIVDVLGRPIMAIPAQSVSAGADRSIEVDASALASGTYIYRVIAQFGSETRVETGKMMLVK